MAAPSEARRPSRRAPALLLLALGACGGEPASGRAAFLEDYGREYRRLRTQASEADWALNTRIVPGDTTAASRSQRAHLALARFAGSAETLGRIRGELAGDDLTPIERRQLQAMLRAGALYAEAAGDVVERRIRLENAQIEKMYGFRYRLDGRSITPNQIDAILRDSEDLELRRAAWEVSKEVGRELRPGLVPLRDLRNASVRALGYEDFSDFKTSGYELPRDVLLERVEGFVHSLWPLYRELHTWARYELARRYGEAVPEALPAHWLPDRWGSDWSAILSEDRSELDAGLGSREPEWIVREAERFYRSVGFEPLPDSFWRRSSLYPLEPDAPHRKNTHASAWHVDLGRDVRALMSVEPDARWYETTHHELGHIYYFLAYGRDDVPAILRAGANRALHEAIGSLLGLASMQRAFLSNRGLISTPTTPEAERRALLREALRFVVFVPWSAGVMTRYEDELYRGRIAEDALNRRWWELKLAYQGIVPPSPRDERWADAAAKTHVTNDPAEYYDYAIAHALLFQLHDVISGEVLRQDPHDTDYFGSTEIGDLLRPLLEAGATRPWSTLIGEVTGRELDASAMAEYFAPLSEWLGEANRGRLYTLPELAP